MKILNIRGGLGNQMFQYAVAIALKQIFPEEDVLIDTHLYKYPIVKSYKGNNFYHNGFEIANIFQNANLPIATWIQVAKVSYYFPNYLVSRAIRKVLPNRKKELVQDVESAFLYQSEVFDNSNYVYYDGYWQSPSYFDFCKQKVCNTFEFKPFDTIENQVLAEKLGEKNSVTIHVRRGDYLNIPLYKNICSLDYYKRAIFEAKRKVQDPVFFIFSNDQNWCRENFNELFDDGESYIVNINTGKNSYRDMQLMSLARCNILANSSFSWWGAYLNQRTDQIVFAPSKWVNMPCSDVYCNNWILI